MTGLIRGRLAALARTISGLKARVRAAVASEVGRAVGDAARQVVEAVVAGRPDPEPHHSPSARWQDDGRDGRWGDPHDPWDDDAYDRGHRTPAPGRPDAPPAPAAGVAAAVTAGVAAARWWAARTGAWLAAAGVGLGVGLLGVLGGPAARAAVAVLAATADVLSATDALGAGAARLDHL